jgi:hypothetical protein
MGSCGAFEYRGDMGRGVVHHALLFADRAIREQNGKHGLVGIFHVLNLPEFPSAQVIFFLYEAFSNIDGEHEFSFELLEDDSSAVTFTAGGEFASSSRDAVLEIALPVHARFRKPGTYTMTFKVDDTSVSSSVITVNEVTTKETLQIHG